MKAIKTSHFYPAEYESLKDILSKKDGIVSVNGCVDPQKLHMVYALGDDFDFKIIVTFSEAKARIMYEDYRF